MHLTLLTLVLAQTASPSIPIRVAIQNESVSLPSPARLFTNFNPGVEVGSEWRYRQTARLTLYQAVTLGMFHHDGLTTAPYVTTTFGVRPTLVGGLFIDAGVSAGYLANISMLTIFSREGGGFRAASPVLHRFIGGLSLALGWQFGRVAPFVSYALLIETPFLPRFSAVLPHQLFQVGVRFEVPVGEVVR